MTSQPNRRSPFRILEIYLLATTVCLIAQPAAMGTGPSVLTASNLGGSQWDTVRAIATDSSQNIYVVGETYSTDFPGGGSTSRLSGDAFIVKLDPTGTQIRFATFLAGSAYDSARGVAVDPSGNVYVTGFTLSSDFPTTSGAYQRTSSSTGVYHAFVAKLTSTGSIIYSTYLGGASSDYAYAVAVDSSGSAYVTGSTTSANFPVTGNIPQSRIGGGTDCFVAKLNPAGAALSYSTYLGGENLDVCRGIAVDGTGAAFVTGTTQSIGFPLVSALDGALAGPSDAFLTKLSPTGSQLLFSTYLGGEGADDGNVVRLDAAGVAYVGGNTGSVGFPVTSGAVQGQNNGLYDGFLCGIANDGSAILFATYLGGSATDSINDLFIAQDGRIVVAGHTASNDFPVLSPFQNSFGGVFDAFVAVLGPNGASLFFASYLGGVGDDRAYGVASLGSGQLVFAGQVLAGSVSYMQQSFSATPAGQYDGFIATVSYEQPLRFIPVTPCRVADTRFGAGQFGPPSISGGGSRAFAILASACGVPVTASAYALNITAVPHGPLAYLTLWPSGQSQPLVSLLNSDGRVKANGAIVPAGANGAVSIFVTDTADIIIDINGYFTPASNPSALAFYPVTPCRLEDTRLASGPFGGPALVGGVIRTFPVLSAPACVIGSTAQAYSLNFTAVPPAPLNFLTTWPAGQSQPLASTLNDLTATIVANAAIVPAGGAGTNGAIDVYASNGTHLVTDINGYFAPPGQAALSLYNIAPCRVFDSRLQTGGQPISGTVSLILTGGSCGVPAAVKAFVLNVTVVPAGALSYLSLWPQGQPQPLVSTLNAIDGAVTSNLAIVPTTNGSISIFAPAPTQIILDISGYFAP